MASVSEQIVNLFAGPGGWDEGFRDLGGVALGIDSSEAACETGRAAGHRRRLADVSSVRPSDLGTVVGLIASPPCQAFTKIGKNLGKLDKAQVVLCAKEICEGRDTRAARLRLCHDPRSLLTMEPMRWAVAVRPRWIALEQVPAVGELWSVFADLLTTLGYHCAVGLLSAEQFGVPQVRKRAFLIASADGDVRLPRPTHRAFDPRRTDVPEEEVHLRRCLTMAQALGWCEAPPARPSWARPAGRSRGCCGGHPRSGDCLGPSWPFSRPSTTVLGDPRITAPGSWPRAGRRSELVRGRPLRVTVAEAGVLQGFRRDYPWRGTRTVRYEQIGSAVCPPVAKAVLREAMLPSGEES
ncbi:MAG TPA: DNA cytosine methyltransferase [Solirubrobacterales bacterium]|nr:DNA cytosine methyltransferase [Solirubrobacterales bacterium]